MSLREAWEENAGAWARAVRDPDWDHHYVRLNLPAFLAIVPPAGTRTLDLGCGEGRLGRVLADLGHRVIGVDASPPLIRLAQEADPGGDYRVADAASLPFEDAAADLVIAFMSLMDMDDMEAAVREAARVLEPGGRFCIALVHPINSAGAFLSDEPQSPFVIETSYFEQRRYADSIERDGLRMTFSSYHRPLEGFLAPLEAAGLLVERLSEIPDTTEPPGSRWRRVPLFLDLRALKR